MIQGVEYILCAAIWYKDLPKCKSLPINCTKGIVACGRRHHDIITQMHHLTGKRTVTNGEDSVGEFTQGFITSFNRFVDRKEAAWIALYANQIEKRKSRLYSEDLY